MKSTSRRCWECLRRQIDCDGDSPVCKACVARGVVCPGFDNKLPLRWLPPGKVTSRTWKKSSRRNVASDPNASTSSHEQSIVAGQANQLKTPPNGAEVSPLSLFIMKTGTDALAQAAVYCECLDNISLPEPCLQSDSTD